ncbi:methyltransferase [Lentzea aerocolonigenes]|uniref:methyltransferase n=1 Tax=Lentzea aerocolonigenes TaxID=68170 RepID=UPI0006965934|nr:methyltransferase [Lentzea aerocolonigenes]
MGGGPAGLILGNLLRAEEIDALVVERAGREQVRTRARAGFLSPNSVRVLTEHGFAGGLLHKGRSHGVCAFRGEDGEFELNYAGLGRGDAHTVYPQQDLVTDLIAEYLDRGGDIRFGVTVTGVDPATASVETAEGVVSGRFLAGCDGSNGVTARLSEVVGRLTLVPGDSTRSIPATGDIYLLSRALHDWDDEQCRTILATCARNMPPHAELFVIERLLPEGADPDSLAIPWDVHMLCNTGGRERSEPDYRALLADAGFELVESHPLPLDAHIMRARRR